MSVIKVFSQLGQAVQQLELDMDSGALSVAGQHDAAIDEFATLFDLNSPTVLQLASTTVQLGYPGDDDSYVLTMTGSGIGPVSSLAALEAAIDASLATGDINRVTVERTFGGSTTTILQLDTTATGYTLTSGVDVLTVTGSLPASFGDLFELDGLLEMLDFAALSAMTSTARAAYFADLSAYGITGISMATDGDTLASISLTPTALTLTIGNLQLEIAGTLPADFGQMAAVAFDLFLQGETLGLPLDLSGIPGLGVDEITLSVVGGQDLLVITGPFTDEVSTRVETLFLDGIERSPTATIDIRSPYSWAISGTQEYLDDMGVISFGSDNAQVGDTINGGASSDYVYGLAGNDFLAGGFGDDLLMGGQGHDGLSGGFGNDTINGGDGTDTLFLSGIGWDVDYTINLQLTKAQSTGQGKDLILGIENVLGGGGHDRIIGNSGRNWLSGSGGDDTLRGGGGQDTLIGGSGYDELDGGAANDVLTGGQGADRFLFNASAGNDRITDFQDGLDRIQISGRTFANVTIADSGADVLVSFGTTRVKLVGVDHTLITEADFLFT